MKKLSLVLILAMTYSILSAQTDEMSVAAQEQVEKTALANPLSSARGWNFEFAGGVGLSQIAYQPWGTKSADPYCTNQIGFPAGNANIGIAYFFVPFMGIGTGVHFSTYTSYGTFNTPWEGDFTDPYGDQYHQTIRMQNFAEKQEMAFLEIPAALKFRYMGAGKKVGFIATIGAKFALPLYNSYSSNRVGTLVNQVYYPTYDLLMHGDVPSVLENGTVPTYSGSIAANKMSDINYAGYAEVGALFSVHRRVDISLSAFVNYYFNDVTKPMTRPASGFRDCMPTGKYEQLPIYANNFSPVINSAAVQSLHPWSAGIKLGIQINAKREGERKKRQAREELVETPADTIVPVVDTEDWWAKHCEENKQEILRLARECDIDLIELAGYKPQPVHDTIIIREPATDAAQTIDEHLQQAVIFFNIDDTVPILQPADILERVAAVLIHHPEVKLEINGHACRLGTPAYNKRLALRRAIAVQHQLINLGVDEKQLVVHSKGANEPFRYNAKHQLAHDRRVELIPFYDLPDEILGLEEPKPQVRVENGKTIETVISGSRLAQIARRHYGVPEYWVFIYQANQNVIANPREIEAGMELVIPDLKQLLRGLTEEEAMDAAAALAEEYLR